MVQNSIRIPSSWYGRSDPFWLPVRLQRMYPQHVSRVSLFFSCSCSWTGLPLKGVGLQVPGVHHST